MHAQALMMAHQPSGGDITSNLSAWWKFDEGSGTTAVNSGSVGSSWNIALAGSPGWTSPGRVGPSAVNYNGTSQWGPTAVVPSTHLAGQDWTIAQWVKSAGSAGAIRMFMAAQNSGASRFYIGYSIADGVGNIGLSSWNGQTYPIANNTWEHRALTMSGTTGSFYLNGSLHSSQAGITISYPANPILFGNNQNGGTTSPINGDQDDTRIYIGRALNATDMALLYAYT